MKKVIILLSILVAIVLCSCSEPVHVDLWKVEMQNHSGSDVYYQRETDELRLIKSGESASFYRIDGTYRMKFYRVDHYISTVDKGQPVNQPVIDEPVSHSVTLSGSDVVVELTYSSTLQVNEI